MADKAKVLEIIDRKVAEAKAEIEALEDEPAGDSEVEQLKTDLAAAQTELASTKVELDSTKESLLAKDSDLAKAQALLALVDSKAKEIDAAIPDAPSA